MTIDDAANDLRDTMLTAAKICRSCQLDRHYSCHTSIKPLRWCRCPLPLCRINVFMQLLPTISLLATISAICMIILQIFS